MQHAGHHEMAPRESSQPAPECAMRAACGGQAAALFAALSNIGLLPHAIAHFDAAVVLTLPTTHESLISQFLSPDAPPPRA